MKSYKPYRSYKSRKDSNTLATCGIYLLIAVVNLFLGGISVQYLIEVFTTKVIPFWGAAIIGLFAGEITIPVAVIVYLLKLFNIF
jgi:hypothetical protein